jgi:tetratricopeptide (TPR) repeat protein/nucleoside phosphorylase
MEEAAQLYDVCIVCALPEEARAFLEVVQRQCDNPPEEGISPRYHYSYRFATIKNDKDEPLNLHLSWLPRYGPQEMTLHLSRVLEEYQPRMAGMTGICAGDASRVQLGDLVVAERTFTYDNGKYTLDEQGRRVHEHDTLTYQLDANLLQFLGLFDAWRPLVACLRRPASPPQLRRSKVACHIKPLASGSAVRADDPFEAVRAPVRGTVAIDMEGAAFGLVMSHHPLIPWLIVKGISDYADRAKNDAYHGYAARASALYALSFIRAYLTAERLPRRDRPAPRGQAGPEGIWNVPYARNPHFTGRDGLFDQLEQHLAAPENPAAVVTRRVALTQPHALTGLGGVGKTQIAVEYAYRSRDQGRYTHALWVNAASEEAIIASFVEIAAMLPGLAARNETDQRKLMEAVKRWLEQCEQPWLLIFDNADEIALVGEYLPQRGTGSIVLTTRAHAVGALAAAIEVETMGLVEGTQLLLRRAQRFEHASDEEINQAGNIVVALDHFPLALDQAGAYIEETQCSFADYLNLYQTHLQALLAQRGMQMTNYPHSVATTWLLSFQKVQQVNPAAAELLHLCSFLAPDRIPLELLRDGAAYWPASLQQAVADSLLFQGLIAELLKFSLVKRLVEDHALSIHRLVQAVQRDRMKAEAPPQWAERVVRALNAVFPDHPKDIAAWPQCLRYLDQAQVCYALIEHYGFAFVEAANVLNRTGLYLDNHALYTIAEPLYQRALTIREQQLGTMHPDTAMSLNNLAALYENQGKYAEAELLYGRVLMIVEQQLGATHSLTAISLNNLAALYENQGKYAEAESLYLRALTIREQQSGAMHPETARSLNNLAHLYQVLGRYEEVEQLLQRAESIWEQQLGATHPTTAIGLNNLATLYWSQGRYEEAEPLFQRVLTIREQQLGAMHPDTATSLNNLALLYRAQERYTEAEPLFRRAVMIREQQLGTMHPDTAQSLQNLAELNSRQGRYAEAELLSKHALAIREQQLGAMHPDIAQSLQNLAELYRAQGKYSEVEPLYRRVLTIREQQLGAMHPDTARSLNNLAALYYQQGRYAEAEPLYQRTLAIWEQRLGPEHPDTQTVRNNYTILLRTMGRDAEAKQLEEEY